MGVSIDGNNITITNATIQIVNGANAESGVAYVIITPDGGVGEIPFMAQGLPGQPTLFPEINLVHVPADQALPSVNPEKVLVDAGGAGLPAKYNLTFYIHDGADGPAGSPSISGASDLAASPALGEETDGFTLAYQHSTGEFVLQAVKVGHMLFATSIAATSSSNTSPRLLSSIAVAAQPFDWYPKVFASTIVTGTGGAEATRVNLVARLNNAASGQQLGFARGLIGANEAQIQTVLLPTFLHGESLSGGYGVVEAGDAATIHLRAEQSAAVSSNWSTPASPDTVFSVEVCPL